MVRRVQVRGQDWESTNWMSYIDDQKLISQITIPGTHDSGATNGGDAFETQDWNISEQLQNGIRYFDIRIRQADDQFYIHHEAHYMGITLDNVVDYFMEFLNANPSETVLMSLKKEYKPENNHKRFLELLQQKFDDYTDTWKKYPSNSNNELFVLNDSISRMADVRKKIVVLKRFSEGNMGINSKIGYNDMGHVGFVKYQDVFKAYGWPGNQESTLQSKRHLITQYLNMAMIFNDTGDNLYLNFTNVSAGLIPRHASKDINATVQDYFTVNSEYRVPSVVILDFADNKDNLVCNIYMNNAKPFYNSSDPDLGHLVGIPVRIKVPGGINSFWESHKDGNSVLLTNRKNSDDTIFVINVEPNGNFKIQHLYSGEYIHFSDDENGNDAHLSATGTLLKFVKNTGSYSFITHGGMHIEREDGNDGSGTYIQLWDTNKDSVKWDIEPVEIFGGLDANLLDRPVTIKVPSGNTYWGVVDESILLQKDGTLFLIKEERTSFDIHYIRISLDSDNNTIGFDGEGNGNDAKVGDNTLLKVIKNPDNTYSFFTEQGFGIEREDGNTGEDTYVQLWDFVDDVDRINWTIESVR
eukprot:TRINITY_DN4610_c0_g2_i1.p1 TRINITY_DN4610_c0_g2~~TRINITY_DN4610_c0_g2_i1.p1  ORF type:complete len:582 (-),score=125.66 TRINITY_DN4610_c0_g2_i1:26-1771(-)